MQRGWLRVMGSVPIGRPGRAGEAHTEGGGSGDGSLAPGNASPNWAILPMRALAPSC